MNKPLEYDIYVSGYAPEISVSDEKVTFKYIAALDGMRAIAVLFVVFYHAILVFPAFDPYLQGGFLGVDIFFVLSGFLITSILLQEFDRTATIGFKNFYIRRFLRLTPAYWVHLSLLFFFAVYLYSAKQTEVLYSHDNFFYAFTYLTNVHRALNGAWITGILGHTWSLAVEEQFYLFWAGFLFLMLRRMKRSSIIATTAVIILTAAFFRAYRWQGPQSIDFLYHSFDSRVDALLIGCLVSQIVSWKILPKSFISSRYFDLLALFSLLIAVTFIFNLSDSYRTPFLYLGGLTIFALAVGVIIMWLAFHGKNKPGNLLEAKPLVWIGKTSYGIYLWHYPLLALFNNFPWSPLSKLVVTLTATFVITALSYYLIETPFLKLKDRFK